MKLSQSLAESPAKVVRAGYVRWKTAVFCQNYARSTLDLDIVEGTTEAEGKKKPVWTPSPPPPLAPTPVHL